MMPSTMEDKTFIPAQIMPEAVSVSDALKAVKAGRANDVDIAAMILADNVDVAGSEEWTKAEDITLMRKVDWRLVPILFVCATLSGLDKSAISTAAIYNLRKDLNLTGQQYSWCGSAPFFGGLLFMGPAAYCLQRLPPVKFFAFNVLCWGIVEMCMAVCNNFAGLFVCRFLLGGFEALLIPAVTMLIAMWYRPEEQPQRNSIILNVIAPVINGFSAWAAGFHKGTFATWKIIFLTFGGFTIFWSLIVFFFLPENPLEAKWLTNRERYMLVQRKAHDNTGLQSKSFKPSQVVEAFLDIKTWLIFLAIIALQIPNGGLTTFNTLIIQGLGFSPRSTALLSMPPGIMSTFSGIGLSYIVARTRKWRTVIVSLSIVLPLIGAVICYTLPRNNVAGQLVGLYILYTYWAPYITLVSIYQANVAGHTKKLTLFAWFYISWASGNIIGPQTFRADQAPAYTGGTIAMIICYVFAIVIILAYGALCRADNQNRAEMETSVVNEQDWLDLTDKENKSFNYTT